VSLLLKSGKENFTNTTKYMGDDIVLPRSSIRIRTTSPEKFEETELPPISKNFDKLKDEPLMETDYQRAKEHVDKIQHTKSRSISRPLFTQ